MHLLVGIGNPAGQLPHGTFLSHERELVEVILSVLPLHLVEMNASPIYSHRCSCLHPSCLNAQSGDALCEEEACRLRTSASWPLCLAYVHEAIQECACCDDYASGQDGYSQIRAYSRYLPVVGEEFFHLILPDAQILRVLQYFPPCPDKLSSVTLGAWAPHGRSLASVEQAKLYGSPVCHLTGVSAQGIHLSYDLSFCYSSYGRVATHLGNLVHVHGDETSFGPHACAGTCCFASGMSTSHYHHIKFHFHI